MSEWRHVSIREVAHEVTVGHVGTMANEYVDVGVPFLRSLNVRPHRLDMTELKRVGRSFHDRLSKSALKPGDVVTVRTGKPGQTAVIPEWLPEANCSDIVITRPGPDLDARWLSYCLNSITEGYIAGQLVGAVQQHFNVQSLASTALALPPIEEQRAVAAVLGALDEKIVANEHVAELLNELVRVRFRELGDNLIRFDSVAQNVKDQVQPTSVGPDVSYVGLEHIARRSSWLSERGLAHEVQSAKWVHAAGDTLFGKLRPYFHKVAWAHFSGICSTDILVVRANDPKLRGYVHAAASADRTVAEVSSASEGTRMPRTNWSNLGAVGVPWPGDAAAQEFSDMAEALAADAGRRCEENERLTAARNGLLPLLMSGKLRVRDAEKLVEQVV